MTFRRIFPPVGCIYPLLKFPRETVRTEERQHKNGDATSKVKEARSTTKASVFRIFEKDITRNVPQWSCNCNGHKNIIKKNSPHEHEDRNKAIHENHKDLRGVQINDANKMSIGEGSRPQDDNNEHRTTWTLLFGNQAALDVAMAGYQLPVYNRRRRPNNKNEHTIPESSKDHDVQHSAISRSRCSTSCTWTEHEVDSACETQGSIEVDVLEAPDETEYVSVTYCMNLRRPPGPRRGPGDDGKSRKKKIAAVPSRQNNDLNQNVFGDPRDEVLEVRTCPPPAAIHHLGMVREEDFCAERLVAPFACLGDTFFKPRVANPSNDLVILVTTDDESSVGGADGDLFCSAEDEDDMQISASHHSHSTPLVLDVDENPDAQLNNVATTIILAWLVEKENHTLREAYDRAYESGLLPDNAGQSLGARCRRILRTSEIAVFGKSSVREGESEVDEEENRY